VDVRHGHRAPVYINPIDGPQWATLGLSSGQLSDVGRAQLRVLGQTLRNRYVVNGIHMTPIHFYGSHFYSIQIE
jgi:broad specificity phosphatase PhoE